MTERMRDEVVRAVGHLRSVGETYPITLAIKDALEHLDRAVAADPVRGQQPLKVYNVYIPVGVRQVDGPREYEFECDEFAVNRVVVRVKADSARQAIDKVSSAITNGVTRVDADLGILVVEPKH